MVDLTEEQLEELFSENRQTNVSVEISTKTGATITVHDDGILKGSLSATDQCSQGDEIQLGSAYVGELDFTVMSSAMTLPRTSLAGATIIPTVSSGSIDTQVGVFKVDKSLWGLTGVELTSYDCMDNFDRAYTGGELTGTPYALLLLACNECGVSFGDNQDYIETLPNATDTLSVAPDSDIDTWRTFIGWVAQAIGGFAIINRYGLLHIGTYKTVPCATIPTDQRNNDSSFSDFLMVYTGMSVVHQEDQTTRYFGNKPDDGLTYNLGTNPFLQEGLDTTIERRVRSILDTIAVGAWVPFRSSLPYTPPIFDLGDCLKFTGGHAGSSSICCVMHWDWTHHDGLELEGFGSDPALATAQSKTDKEISGLLSQVSSDTVQYYPFVNTDGYSFGPRAEVLSITFASTKETTVQFDANICLEALGDITDELDDNGKLTARTYHRTKLSCEYEMNDTVLETMPMESYCDGPHILHLFRPIGAQKDIANTLVLWLKAQDGIIKINPGAIRAMVSGSGLAANDNKWDRTHEFRATFGLSLAYVAEASPQIRFTDDMGVSDNGSFYEALTSKISLSLSRTGLSIPYHGGLTDATGTEAAVVVLDESKRDRCTYDAAAFDITSGGFTAVSDATIISWLMGRDYATVGVSSITATVTDGVRISTSFDNGLTWVKWNGSSWTACDASDGMSAEDLKALTEADWALVFNHMLKVRAFLPAATTLTNINITFDIKDWS